MKALKIIRNVVAWLMVVLAAGMMIFTIVSVSTFDRTDRKLFGYKAFIVLTDSMSKTDFDAGDLVLVKEVDPSTLAEGDIIAFISQDSSNFCASACCKASCKVIESPPSVFTGWPRAFRFASFSA